MRGRGSALVLMIISLLLLPACAARDPRPAAQQPAQR
jgi:outer membrane biogenesis lipoprotein LolB